MESGWCVPRFSVSDRLKNWSPPEGSTKHNRLVRALILVKSGVGVGDAAKKVGMTKNGLYRAIFKKYPRTTPKTIDANTRLRRIWDGMMRRCYVKENSSYSGYGGRGIVVCKSWHEYLNFKKWALSNGYNDNLTLERSRNNSMYRPSNCHWDTSKNQARNRRSSRFVVVNGVRKTIAEWSDIYEVRYQMAWERIRYLGWEPIDAFTKPRRKL